MAEFKAKFAGLYSSRAESTDDGRVYPVVWENCSFYTIRPMEEPEYMHPEKVPWMNTNEFLPDAWIKEWRKIIQKKDTLLAPPGLPSIETVSLMLNSGGGIHAVGDPRLLKGMKIFSTPKRAVQPDGSSLCVVGVGTLQVGERFDIPDVYLVKGLAMNLISVGQLDKNHGMCCCFHSKKCEIMLPDGTVVGGGFQKDDGMYELYFLLVPPVEE